MQHEKQRGRIEIKEERRACWCCACSTKSCPPSFHHHYHLFFFLRVVQTLTKNSKANRPTDRPALLLRSLRALSSPFCSRPPHLLLYNFCFILLLLLFFFFYVVVILPFRFHWNHFPPIRTVMIYLDSIFLPSSSSTFDFLVWTFDVFFSISFSLTRKGNRFHVNIWIDHLEAFLLWVIQADSPFSPCRCFFLFLLGLWEGGGLQKYSNDDIHVLLYIVCCCRCWSGWPCLATDGNKRTGFCCFAN